MISYNLRALGQTGRGYVSGSTIAGNSALFSYRERHRSTKVGFPRIWILERNKSLQSTATPALHYSAVRDWHHRCDLKLDRLSKLV